MQLTVAALQMTSTRDVDANLRQATELSRAAAAAGAQFLVLPENFAYLGGDNELPKFAQPIEGGRFSSPMRALARQLGVSILLGSLPEAGPDPEHVYAASVLIGPQGDTLAVYRKMHLFDIDLAEASFRESAQITPGDSPLVAAVGGWPVGLSICYDLRFPELYRALVAKGARILTVPAAFTAHTGKDHWEPLLRARAIENQCYVIAAGQFGRHNDKRVTWGKSMVVDPWGSVVAAAPERPSFALAPCDGAYQDEVRRGLPCLRHRRIT